MKQLTTLFTLILIIAMMSCEDSSPKTSCIIPIEPSITVSGNSINFTQHNHAGAGFFELEYGELGFQIGTGTRSQINVGQITINNLAPGSYDLYIRSNCGSSDWSDWNDASSFLIQ